uniref:Elongation of very long chain fatty acids protein n=1 Tax=Electrophorus electricus TaxID=8005 RepID=A0AAY5F402_ELEEL
GSAPLIFCTERIAHERVAQWLTMQSSVNTLGISALYLLFLWVGPRYMRGWDAFHLRETLIVYNFSMVLLNFYICKEVHDVNKVQVKVTHTHTHTRTRTHSHTHACTRIHTHALTCTHSHTRTHTHSHTHVCYGLAAFISRVQELLWWKENLTIVQMVTMEINLGHTAHPLDMGCPFPVWMQWTLSGYTITFITLFANFYYLTLERNHSSCGNLCFGL